LVIERKPVFDFEPKSTDVGLVNLRLRSVRFGDDRIIYGDRKISKFEIIERRGNREAITFFVSISVMFQDKEEFNGIISLGYVGVGGNYYLVESQVIHCGS
jgi:hypothetical protein